MTDTPKRIYAWVVPPTSHLVGTWCVTRYPDAAEEYILAAEHDRIVAEKDAEIERLREAVVRARNYIHGGMFDRPLPVIRQLDEAMGGERG